MRVWPVLRDYDHDHLATIAMPLGGIGTGTVSLGGRGDLRDWELDGTPRKGYRPADAYFLLRYGGSDGRPAARLLEAEMQAPFEHHRGFHERGRFAECGLPRFRRGAFRVAYPLAQVELEDPAVPLRVRLEAFNPLVPGDSAASGIPIAVLRFVLHNPTDEVQEVALLGSLPNDLGAHTPDAGAADHLNRVRTEAGLQGVFLEAPGLPEHAPERGTLALATDAPAARVQCCARRPAPGRDPLSREVFWRRYVATGTLEEPAAGETRPIAGINVAATVEPGESVAIPFLLGWHFPNRRAWSVGPRTDMSEAELNVGNWYATRYADAWEVLARTRPELPALEDRTVAFVRALTGSTVPPALQEAALFNLSTLRSTTCFRTAEGHFFGFEGSNPGGGCCPGNCTHVWAYESATESLFGDLARSMRETHLLHATDADGAMSFRLPLPLSRGPEDYPHTAADGQMATLLKLHRDWKLCGDRDWLARLWPAAKRCLEYCWIENGWDADRDGVMEGVQHTTTDIELFGPNPVITGWYLAALRAMAELAAVMEEPDFAAACRELADRGGAWVAEHLFNGEHYVQQVRRPPPRSEVPPKLWMALTVEDGEPPPQQIEEGCQTDQLIGALWARLCGLPPILPAAQVRRTLATIYGRNAGTEREAPSFFRAFALNGESAVRFGTYPEGAVPAQPNFRFSEVWNGCEYALAAHLIYEGRPEAGLAIIRAVRDRHDGRKRNPFNEPECGNHYARSLASWSCYLAWTGFDYDAAAGTLAFRRPLEPATYFWSTGAAAGTVRLAPGPAGVAVELRLLEGGLTLAALRLEGAGTWTPAEPVALAPDRGLSCTVAPGEGG